MSQNYWTIFKELSLVGRMVSLLNFFEDYK